MTLREGFTTLPVALQSHNYFRKKTKMRIHISHCAVLCPKGAKAAVGEPADSSAQMEAMKPAPLVVIILFTATRIVKNANLTSGRP